MELHNFADVAPDAAIDAQSDGGPPGSPSVSLVASTPRVATFLRVMAESGLGEVLVPTVFFSEQHLRFWREFGEVMGQPPVYIRSTRTTYFVRSEEKHVSLPLLPEILKKVELRAKMGAFVTQY